MGISQKVKIADYVINKLSEYIDTVFLVYGAANGDLVDAFTRNDKIKYVAVMHEQAGGFAAEGYAKTSGKFGCALATSGPGGHNFVTPIGNCFYDSVPCIFLTGQINSRFIKPDSSIRQIGFQETEIIDIVKPITKYAVCIKNANDIRFELEKCIHTMLSGRPGPVLLDIPLDIQKTEIDPENLIGYKPITQKYYSQNELKTFICNLQNDIKKSKRPVILVGGGCWSYRYELKRVLENIIRIPTFPTWNALDIITSDMKYYGGRVGTYGGAGRNFAIQNADLFICLGSRLSGRITGGNLSSFSRESKKYIIDIDPSNIQTKYQQVPFDNGLCISVEEFIPRFLEEYESPEIKDWIEQVYEWRDKYDPVKEKDLNSEFVHPYLFGDILSKKLSNKDVVVGDCGGNIVVLNHSLKTQFGQRYFTNNGNSPMGFSFAGGLGACFAKPEGSVVAVIGDGGFNMNIQELQTLINYNIPLKTFILNNHIYGITKAFQKTNFQGRMEACGPVGYNPPNFLKIVEAYGIKTFYVDKNENLEKTIEEVLKYDGPCVCDVNCHEYHTYQPRIFGWKTPIEDMYPYLDREEFLSNMIVEPLDSYKNPEVPNIE